LQLKATEQFDIELINSCEAGWAHRDLFVDNLLFVDNQVSAILDFDRFAYDYPELDIARVIVSGALDKENLNITAATAFLDGYRTQREFERGVLTRSLHMLWYMESVWWIHTNMDTTRAQPIRFAEEMTWLAKNLSQFSGMIGHL
jgi:homoserine kinase type II